MNLLAVERIKLFSTRSPWWCLGLAAALMIGLAALISALSAAGTLDSGELLGIYGLSMMVVLVMCAIAVTTEYRFSTIRATFTAVPNRTAVLLSKTAVVAIVAGLAGGLIALAAWGLAYVIKPHEMLAISTPEQWRYLLGIGPVFAISAVIAVAVGILVRQTAAAISILLVWTLLVESLIGLIPKVGDDIQKWMPWMAGNHFLTAGSFGEGGGFGLQMPLGPWASLAYFAGVAFALLAIALVVAERRDA